MQQDVSGFISSQDMFTDISACDTMLTQTGHSFCYRSHINERLYFKKSLKPEYLSDNKHRSAYRKEFCLGFSIDCPYVVKYRKIIDTQDECTLLLDYVEGNTIQELVSENPHYFDDRNRLSRFVRQMLEALSYLHKRQIIHMDINPMNVMISDKTGDVKIVDLGFSYSDSYQDTVGTTKEFSASELNRNTKDFDVRTDIYGFGAVLSYINEHCPSALPSKFRHVMSKCLQEEKDKRYNSADEILKFLFDDAVKQRVITACTIVLTLVITATVFLYFDGPRYIHRQLYGYDYIDRRGVKFNVISKDSLTCEVVGYDVAYDQANPWDFGHIAIMRTSEYQGNTYDITEIADSAFMGDTIITEIAIMPKKIKVGIASMSQMRKLVRVNFEGDDVTLEGETFAVSKQLETIALPRNLKAIPNMCFQACKFKHLNLPEGITEINQDAFAGSKSLVDAVLPSTVVTLGRGVFYANDSLEEVRIPAATKNIGIYCFMNCPKLKRIYNYAVKPQQVQELFDDNTNITIYVPRQSVELYRNAPVWKTQTIKALP